MPYIFKDSTGREWDLKIHQGIVNRLKDAKVIDLTRILEKEMQRYNELMSNAFDLLGVVWEIIKPHADAANIDFENWCAALDGDALEAMNEAFQRAIADFFPPLRGVILKGLEKGKVVKTATANRVIEEIDKADAEKIADLAGQKTAERIASLMDSVGGALSGSTAAISESTPPPIQTPSP